MSTIATASSTSHMRVSTYAGTNYANPHAATQISSATLTYDNNGNMTAHNADTYAWDYRNRLASSTVGGVATTYGYDHANSRVTKTTAGDTTTYVNDLYTIAPDGTIKKHIMLGDTLAATVTTLTGEAPETTYIHSDHLGGTNVVTDEEGHVAQTLDYYPFGSERIATGDNSTDRHFIGERFDSESGLNYLNARYYQSNEGRFLSEDLVFWEVGQTQDGKSVLVNPQAQNSYSYAQNNPIIKKDPDGRIAFLAPLAIGAGAAMLGQYGYDVFENSQDGFRASDFTSNLSSPKTYAVRGIQGATIAATGGAVTSLGAAYGIGTVGQSVAVGGASGLIGAGGNAYLGQPVTPSSFVIETIVGGFTFGASSLVPKVPGRLPNFGTNAFYTGKHTQQSAVNLAVDGGSNYISSVLTQLVSTLTSLRDSMKQQQNQKKDDKKKSN